MDLRGRVVTRAPPHLGMARVPPMRRMYTVCSTRRCMGSSSSSWILAMANIASRSAARPASRRGARQPQHPPGASATCRSARY
jgi:hypothetical protein